LMALDVQQKLNHPSSIGKENIFFKWNRVLFFFFAIY
jgi:hypothetical protein